MPVNLVTKYGNKLDKGFERRSLVADKCSTRFDWIGGEAIKLLHMLPSALNNFNRSASANRFGTPANVQDGVQTMLLTQDKSYTGTIDRGDNSQQYMLKKAGEWIKLQDSEVVIPTYDAYAIGQFIMNAGKINTISAAPSASTIIEALIDMENHMNNNGVPQDQRWVYVGWTNMKYIRLADEWQGCDSIVNKILANGHVGNFGSLHICPVPDKYFPSNAYAVATRKESVFAPTTLLTARILEQVQGFDGPVIEGRRIYDAFVSWPQSDGVVALVKTSEKLTAPTISVAGQITVGTGETVKYTKDGSDPRYSATAVAITSTATPTHTAGDVIKGVTYKSGKFPSDITSTTTTS